MKLLLLLLLAPALLASAGCAESVATTDKPVAVRSDQTAEPMPVAHPAQPAVEAQPVQPVQCDPTTYIPCDNRPAPPPRPHDPSITCNLTTYIPCDNGYPPV